MHIVNIIFNLVGTLQFLQIGASGFAFLLGSLVTNTQAIVQINPVANIPLLLLSGWFANANNFAPYLIPFKYISLFKYGYQILTHLEFEGGKSSNNCVNVRPDMCNTLAIRLQFLEPFYVSYIAIACLIILFNSLAFLFMWLWAKKKV